MALDAWRESIGESVSGKPTEVDFERLVPAQALTNCVVTDDDHGDLATVPDSWRQRAKLPWLGYETILEKMAERFHVSEACLRELNPEVAWPDPPAGTQLVVPAVAFSCPSAARLEVHLGWKFVRAYDEEGRIVAHFPCSVARLKEKRPQGHSSVVNAAENPVYTFDPVLFSEDPEAREITGKLIIQAGPNNPVGAAWVGLALPGYGIHGTPWPEDIGKTESHGCIRLANWNARKLVHMVRLGIPVQFVGMTNETDPR
jgi:lipoprotein-anchoring transpeptidase ErfK/SrfK